MLLQLGKRAEEKEFNDRFNRVTSVLQEAEELISYHHSQEAEQPDEHIVTAITTIQRCREEFTHRRDAYRTVCDGAKRLIKEIIKERDEERRLDVDSVPRELFTTNMSVSEKIMDKYADSIGYPNRIKTKWLTQGSPLITKGIYTRSDEDKKPFTERIRQVEALQEQLNASDDIRQALIHTLTEIETLLIPACELLRDEKRRQLDTREQRLTEHYDTKTTKQLQSWLAPVSLDEE